MISIDKHSSQKSIFSISDDEKVEKNTTVSDDEKEQEEEEEEEQGDLNCAQVSQVIRSDKQSSQQSIFSISDDEKDEKNTTVKEEEEQEEEQQEEEEQEEEEEQQDPFKCSCENPPNLSAYHCCLCKEAFTTPLAVKHHLALKHYQQVLIQLYHGSSKECPLCPHICETVKEQLTHMAVIHAMVILQKIISLNILRRRVKYF